VPLRHLAGASGTRSIAPGEFGSGQDSQSPYSASAAGFAHEAKWGQAALLTRGQNVNRCASFVSVDTGFHGLFWPKIAEMAETNDPVKT
jgi:hypothetical protein